ncbi:MAG TPA: thiamine-phosphate kinase [Chthoniobacterales bacterium]|jgi:thiamine-monophosphate kinase|nr:thiamine-phosphate kinase [Chthoniobacterales bacterium]
MKRSRSARGRTRLGEVGEDALLTSLLRDLPRSRRFIGDDCAVVGFCDAKNLLVLKTDCVVERLHFQPDADPTLVGWKAMMRPLSDFAAISGVPQFALITLIVPAAKSTSWVKKLYRGLERAAARFDVLIVGGETSATRGSAAISVGVSGFVEQNRSVSRSGGKRGDDLFVTGKLGGSLRGKHLRFVPRITESRWLTKNFHVHAMMDLSDGLGVDLPRLAKASGLGFKLEKESLPLTRGATIRNAISDGEDYELLFAISPPDRRRLERMWKRKFPKLPLTRIGSFTQRLNSASPARTSTSQLLPSGYVHFQ